MNPSSISSLLTISTAHTFCRFYFFRASFISALHVHTYIRNNSIVVWGKQQHLLGPSEALISLLDDLARPSEQLAGSEPCA